MGVVGVDSAVRKEPGQVEPASCGLGPGDTVEEHGVGEEIAIRDRLADPGQVLVDDPSRADVQVPDFRVPHLPLGESHRHAGGTDVGTGVVGAEARHVGGPRLDDGIVLTLGADPPTVQDHQQQGLFWHVSSIRMRLMAKGKRLRENLAVSFSPTPLALRL